MLNAAMPNTNMPSLVPSKLPATTHLSAAQKAAVIVVLLGPDAAKPIVSQFDDRQLKLLIGAYKGLKQVSRDVMLGAVAEFVAALNVSAGGIRGGDKRARELAQDLLDSDRAKRMLGEAVITDDMNAWEELATRPVGEIVAYLETKPAEIVSIILAQLGPDKVGEILPELPEDTSNICVIRLSRKMSIVPTTISALEQVVTAEFLRADRTDENAQAAAYMGDVLSILPKDKRDVLLAHLEATDADQAEKVKGNMMTVEDLPDRLPPTAIPILFREMDADNLVKCLKAIGSQFPLVTDFFYANISQRMAGQYKEQTEEMSALSSKESDSAISSFMAYVSKLEKRGLITLIRPILED